MAAQTLIWMDPGAGRWCNSELPGVVADVLNSRRNRPIQILFPLQGSKSKRSKMTSWLEKEPSEPATSAPSHHQQPELQFENQESHKVKKPKFRAEAVRGWSQWLHLSTQWVAKHFYSKVCLLLPSAAEAYLQGVQSALCVLRRIMDFDCCKDSEFELSGIVVFFWQVFC